jgi:hypothetical protein
MKSAGVVITLRRSKTDQKQTGHKSRAMLDRYIRSAELFKDNAAGTVGL